MTTNPPADAAKLRELLAKATPRPWKHYNEVFRPQFSRRRVTEIQNGDGKSIICWGGFDGLPNVTARKANANAALIVETVNALPALLDQLAAQASQIEALTAEVETLQKWAKGQWFYNAEDPEHAFYDPSEVIDFIDLESGHHVIEVAVSASLPSIWCAVRVTDDDNADERFTHTEHSSEAEARAALEGADK